MLQKCATSRYWLSNESAIAPGHGKTFIDEWIVLSAVDMTSITLAPKLAMYREPRDSSSAMSDAEPPIATTDPKTGALPDARDEADARARIKTKCRWGRMGADGL